MNKKVMSVGLACLLGVSSFYVTTDHVSAVSNQEIQNKKNEMNQVKNQRSTIQSQIKSSENELATIKNKQANVVAEINRLDSSLNETTRKIQDTKGKIEKTQSEIKELEKKIAEVTERINERNDLLKERARSLQRSGGVVSYLEVLLGSQSFGDFINRMNAVATIMEADKEILKQHEADKQLKEAEEKKLNESLIAIEAALANLKEMKASFEVKMAQRTKLFEQLEEEEEHAEDAKMELQEKNQILAKQESAIKRQIQLLEEQKRRESSPGGGKQKIEVSNGNFTKPTVGRLTSPFGSRWGGLHAGIDIANSTGTPVVAAADGVIFMSYRSSSYGNVVFVTHNVNGQVYTTVYAHLSSRSVSENQVIKKGQLVGYMGSTGDSSGPHLHFELHKGMWNYSKSNAVNPAHYINF